jgi:nucleotide-binding universal stress UspA family protein
VDPAAAREVDDESRDHADRVANEGVELAKSLGLQSEAVAVADEGNVADAIVELARRRDVAAIVVGSRGLSGLRARLEGSTSTAVAKHASCPVVLVHDD